MTARPERRRVRLVFPGLLAVLMLSACGATSRVATLTGDDDATPTPSASTASEDPEEAMLAFTECMRENGIEMPDPVVRRFDGSGGEAGGTDGQPGDGPIFDPNSEEFQAAQEACQGHLEGLAAMEPGDAPRLSAEDEAALLAFAECMREHGIDMPDPGAGGAIMIAPDSDTTFDPRSEEFGAAEEACREHLEGVLDNAPEEVAP